MKQLQSIASAVLAKIDQLLTTEPVRVIAYGAAVVIYLVARVLADHGYLNLPLTFDQSVTAAFGAIATLVILVESMRRFVYAPMTYIEDLSDESQAAHEAAHVEEAAQRVLNSIMQPSAPTTEVAVMAAPPAGSKDKLN